MTTIQAYDQATTGESGEASPFLVLPDQTLTGRAGETDEPAARQWLNRLPCMARPIRPGDLVMVNVETGETCLDLIAPAA